METPTRGHLANPPPAGGGEVQLWIASLAVHPDVLERLEATISDAERARAARFHFDVHRNRFVAGRGLLRAILSRYSDVEPRMLEFALGPSGKPELCGESARAGLHFNLAHCEDMAVVGVTRRARIGVDVERIRPLPDMDRLLATLLSPSESDAFAGLGEEAKPAAFFNLWTRKEAWLKATGQGIARDLDRVRVSFLPGEPVLLKQLPADLGDASAWTLGSIEPASGFVAAVAVERRYLALEQRHWSGSFSSANAE